jgi:hypothetical protein
MSFPGEGWFYSNGRLTKRENIRVLKIHIVCPIFHSMMWKLAFFWALNARRISMSVLWAETVDSDKCEVSTSLVITDKSYKYLYLSQRIRGIGTKVSRFKNNGFHCLGIFEIGMLLGKLIGLDIWNNEFEMMSVPTARNVEQLWNKPHLPFKNVLWDRWPAFRKSDVLVPTD